MASALLPDIVVDSDDAAIHVTAKRKYAAAIAIALVAIALAMGVTQRSSEPIVILAFGSVLLVERRWTIVREGLILKRSVAFVGVVLYTRRISLSRKDQMSVELIEDSPLLVRRPRWYWLTLWSDKLSRDIRLLQSSDVGALQAACDQFNAVLQGRTVETA